MKQVPSTSDKCLISRGNITCCGRRSTSRSLSSRALRLLSSAHWLLRPLWRCDMGRPGRTLLLLLLRTASLHIMRNNSF